MKTGVVDVELLIAEMLNNNQLSTFNMRPSMTARNS